MKTKLLFLLLICSSLFSENYTRTYNPTAGTTSITIDELFGEFDEIGRICRGLLATSNFKNASLKAEDIESLTLTGSNFATGTLRPSVIANLDDLAEGDLLYASATSTLNNFPIGENGKVLYSDGFAISWADAPSLPWTDDTGLVKTTSVDDNVCIGSTSTTSDGKAVLSLVNNTVPTTSITNGCQLYAEKYTNPTLVTLLNFNGTDGSTTFTDSSYYNNTYSPWSLAQIDTAQSKFGTGSLLLNTTSRISTESTNLAVGSGNFTIDFWVRFNSITNAQFFFNPYNKQSPGYLLYYLIKSSNANGNKIHFVATSNTLGTFVNYEMTSSWSGCAINTWYHIALVRNGTSIYIFINGISQPLKVNTAIGSSNLGTNSSDFYIGVNAGNNLDGVNGWLDDFRVTKGSALWTSNFTPPTSELNVGVTSELKVRDEAGNITTKSPHDFSLIPSERLQTYFLPYTFTSKNEAIGTKIQVDMYGFLKELEKLSKKQFVFERELNK